MNIDEYRAMKEQEEKQNQEGSLEKDQPDKEGELGESEDTSKEQSQEHQVTSESTETKTDSGEEDKPTDTESQPSTDGEKGDTKLPEKVHIEGVGEVDVEELKNGYLRQSDYTKKTQEVARQREETQEAINFYEQLKNNPKLATQVKKQGVKPPKKADPATAKVTELEDKYYDLMLEREIEKMQNKYDDFEAKEILNIAHEKGISNLEDAYKIAKASKAEGDANIKKGSAEESSTSDKESLKEELRKEIMQELASDEKNTESVISTSDSKEVVSDGTPQLSEGEKKVALNMFRDSNDPVGEYAKWRDANK